MIRSLAVTLACSTAVAGTIDDGRPDSAYLKYAEGFAPFTVQLKAALSDDTPHVATAVLVADRWALTAAHVVHDCDRVSVDGVEMDKVVVHKDWEDNLGEYDIALLHSTKSFGRAFYPPLATARHKPGSVVSVAGYGLTGPMSAGYGNAYDGRLRAGTNVIERYERHMIVCGIRRGSSPLEYGIAPGDSGGPLFCDGELAGINSATMADRGPLRSREGEESCHIDVSQYAPWIKEVINE